jgi:hypothetical protein
MRAVEKNTFYKRSTLTTASVVTPNFGDLPVGSSGDLISLQGGFKETAYTLSGSIAETPAYGNSELIGGYLNVFVSGVTLATTPTLPQIELYRLKPGVEVAEGRMSVAYLSGNVANTGVNPTTNVDYLDGADIVVYHSVLDTDNRLISENFDGADKTLGNINILKSAGTGVVEMSSAFLPISVGKAKAAGGLGNLLGQYKTFSLTKYFSQNGQDIRIKPETDDINGVWRPAYDGRKGNKQKLTWKKPFWKYKDIKDVIQFKAKSPVAGSTDNDVGGSPGNTIFDEVYQSANMNNPFTSSESNPLLMTKCELSAERKFGGAQSFRMYHLWDYSTASANLQKAMGSRQISPSVTRASIFNIPYPTWTSSDDLAFGSSTFALPEISMKMNISKLQFTPYLAAARTLSASAAGFDTAKSYYPSGTGSSTAPTYTASTQMLNTGFLRSVTVTFSNYKPKSDHTTLDKFLDYGLERYYTGENSEHIVGGVTFRKVGIDTDTVDTNPQVIMASAIPVAPWWGTGNTSTVISPSSAPGVNLKYGLTKLTLGDTAAGLQNTMMLGLVDWTNFGNGLESNEGVRQVELPIDTWFNMRTFIDIQQPNSVLSAQSNVYDSFQPTTEKQYAAAGSPMRVYFESEIPVSGTVADEDSLKNVPFVDVYFPAIYDNNWNASGNAPSSAPSAIYNWQDNPEMYPKHMTIWVQNFRWIDGTASDSFATYNTYANSAGIFGWGDAQGALPSGAAIEAELYVDNIDFKNFIPDVTNCSPGASVGTQQSLSFRQEGYTSPRHEQFRTINSGWTTSGASRKAWESNVSSVSGNMAVHDSIENICIGFEDPAMLPVKNLNSYTGYVLFNGFNTMQMGSLDRVQPSGTISQLSYSNSAVQRLGGQNWGKVYWAGVGATASQTFDSNLKTSYNDINLNKIFTTGDTGDITSSVHSTRSALGNKGQINYLTSDNDGTGASGIGPVPSQDGFTSKGLLRIYCSGTDIASATTGYNWAKREHVMASTKIIGVPGAAGKNIDRLNENQIVVNDPTIFNKYLNDEFIIYLMGESFTNTSITATGNASTKGWGVHANSTSLKLAEGIEIDSAKKIITLNTNIVISDQGTTKLCTEENLSRLWISPKKYWVTMWQPANKVSRTYQNAVVVQDVGANGTSNTNPITALSMSGSTWNESIYGFDASLVGTTGTPPTDKVGRSGLYTHSWWLDPSVSNSTLITNKDYGYGAYDEEENQGGEVAQATALINKYVELDLTALAKSRDTSPGEDLVFRMGLNDSGLEKVHIFSDEYTTDVGKVPTIYWEYKDELPKITAPLTLTPNFNILSGSGQNKVDLYKLDREELNAVKFSWGEEGDDILYRLLYISTNSITNKYEDTAFHAPLNEMPNNNREATGSYYVGASRIKAGNLAPLTKRSITGSSGWAYDGVHATSTSQIDWPQTAASVAWSYFENEEATFVAHGVPNDTTSQTQGTMFTDNSTRGAFKIYYTKAASANADVTPVVALTSGTTVVSGKTVTLTSDYSFPNDGESPLFVVVTFNSNLDSNHIKMYVNGRLVKQSAGTWTKGNKLYSGASYDGKINIGNEADTGGTKKFRGTMQECFVHNKQLHVPTSSEEYVLSTEFLPDKTAAGGTAIKYNARLFLYDYHNIIGSSRDTVCTSNLVSWEATSI